MRKMSLVIASVLTLWATTLSNRGLAQSSVVDGQVAKIDQTAGKITLKHGPLKNLGMDEGMTMVFRVQDPAMLKGVKVGDKVKFEADKVNGQFTVVKMQKAN
ncbi:MAG: copper-binding protein [Rhizobiales bacterium]|nr:copper-binding protein [Hyphomicrobiales bacterium]